MVYKGKDLRSDVVLMILDSSKIGEQEIKLNTKKKLSTGDILVYGSDEITVSYELTEIIESRPSSISNYSYVTAMANRQLAHFQ